MCTVIVTIRAVLWYVTSLVGTLLILVSLFSDRWMVGTPSLSNVSSGGEKTSNGLELDNCVEEITDTYSGKAYLYHRTLRIGISHGKMVFQENTITYLDNQGNYEERSLKEVVTLFDELVDFCNGASAALRTFVFSNKSFLSIQKFYRTTV